MKKTAKQLMSELKPESIKAPMPGFGKQASLDADMSMGMSYGRTPLYWQDPLYDSMLIMFPEYNLVEANKRYRHFYKFNPVLSSCVDVHATFPLSDFEIMCPNEEVKDYYTFTAERLKLLDMAEHSLRDIALLGESVHIGNWDIENLEWEEWIQYAPEFVDIITVPGSSKKIFKVKPLPEVNKLLTSNTEAADILSRALIQADKQYYEAAIDNKDYIIPDKRIMYMANQVDGYSSRGYPLTKRALPDLMYELQIRSLQHTFVQRHMFPIKIFKLGSEAMGWVPSQKHFEQFKQLLIQACHSEDTEFLTDSGYKHFSDITENDKVAAYDIENNDIVFEKPVRRIEYETDKPMVHIKNEYVDIMVTEDHRLMVYIDDVLTQILAKDLLKVIEEGHTVEFLVPDEE